jgi:hypothetical protein
MPPAAIRTVLRLGTTSPPDVTTTGVVRIEAFTVRRKVDFITSGSGPVSLVARHSKSRISPILPAAVG